MKTTNERVQNIKGNSHLVKVLIDDLKYSQRHLQFNLRQLKKSDKFAWEIRNKAETIFENDFRVIYLKKSLRIVASKGVEWLKPTLTRYLVNKSSTLNSSSSEVANTFSKIEIKVIGELISRLDLHSI